MAHKHVICIIILALAHCNADREFPLSLWKNYELDESVLVVSHSEKNGHAVWFGDRVNVEWRGEYQLSDGKIIMEFRKNEEVL